MTHILLVFAGHTLKAGGDTRRRVRATLDYLRAQSLHRGEWYVICLGGRFNSETAKIAAGTRMKEWIQAEDLIPASHVLADTFSRDTFENLSCAMALVKKIGARTQDRELLIVSHPWHLERIQVVLHRVYQVSAKMVPVWHRLTLKQRLAEIILSIYLPLDPRGEKWPMRWLRAKRSRLAQSKKAT